MSAIFEFLSAGNQETMLGPHNLQIERMESLDGLSNLNFDLPLVPSDIQDEDESNNPDLAMFSNVIYDNCENDSNPEMTLRCASNALIVDNCQIGTQNLPEKCRAKLGRWDRLKCFLPNAKGSSFLCGARPRSTR